MADITIGIVASAREWRSVLQAHVRDHVAGVRVQILREPRMALELDLDVIVIDDVSSFLTRDKVVRLREKGTRVVGIYDPEGNEGLGITFLENLGVDLSLPSNISPEEMINAVSQMKPRENYGRTFDNMVADFTADQSVRVGETMATLVAVSGPAGTGSTEIAIALADVLSSRREPTLLLDSDEVGPSVARRLGFHLHPNILSAIDAVSNVTHPLREMVGRPSDRAASSVNFDVMPGIANAEDWAQLRSMDLADLFIAARKTWRYIVCNTGPFAEDLSGYGIERFGATRAALEDADVIIGVMSPTPTGYLRFLDWMTSIRTLGAERSVFIVVNRAPKSSYVRGEIESQLARDIDARYIAGLFFIPVDERVAKAEWEGQRVGNGPFLSGVADVAAYALPPAYSSAKNHVQPVQGYTSAPSQGVQPVNVSWNDPDVANPPAAPPAPTNISLEEPSAFFESAAPLEDVPDMQQLEETIGQSLAQPDAETPVVAQPPAQPYSYDPSEHRYEDAPVAQPVPPSSPAQDFGEGYVPAFKRGLEDDAPAQYSPPPVPPVEPSTYLPQTQAAPPSEQETNKGYVPHFIDEKQDEDDNNNDSFWGQ